jgi:TonB family protein
MNTMDANRTLSGAAMSSPLPRFCLPAPKRDGERTLAWVNSVCILFLLIGVTGAKNAFMSVKRPPPIEDAAPVIVEPVTPPQQATPDQKQEPVEPDKSAAPPVVAVTLDTPAINFSVPTVGNLLVPNAMAAAPPSQDLKAVAQLSSRPVAINSTGGGGERPQPPYPKIALEQGQQGTVVLQMTVDDAGLITAIELKDSSGHPLLDRSALDFVKRHWIVPPGQGTRLYEATIIYKLRINE